MFFVLHICAINTKLFTYTYAHTYTHTETDAHLMMLCGLYFSSFDFCSRDELKQIVTSDIRHLLGAEGEPTFVKYIIISVIYSILRARVYQ